MTLDTSKTGGISVSRTVTRFPRWLRRPLPLKGKKEIVEHCITEGTLHTVCEEAKCPNRGECYSKGTATFLLLGNNCTRSCQFCSVDHCVPQAPESDEPQSVCDAVKTMGLSYVVLTMVTRDDLTDGGADYIAKTIRLLKRNINTVQIEVLISDFGGNMESLKTVLESKPDVLNHNIETVPSLYSHIRPEADYQRSLNLLSSAFEIAPSTLIKSGFMVGFGETEENIFDLMRDLYASHVSIVTIGQYLRPSKKQIPVTEFIAPEQFERYRDFGLDLDFSEVVAGSFVRSSYHAGEVFTNINGNKAL